ncbi:MAG: hypothetical protein ACTSQV_00340 [Alphaproteobacteria bacterium]
MALGIETFSNIKGSNAFYKAVSHPLAAAGARALVAGLKAAGPVAIYDPMGVIEGFAAFHDLSGVEVAQVFVQDIDAIGNSVLGCTAQPVTDMAASSAATVFAVIFDAERPLRHIRHLVPDGARVVSLDHMRLDDDLLTNKRHYLDGLNFATNFAFFRDAEGRHTRVATANYWAGYGAAAPAMRLVLFGGNGEILADWTEDLGGEISSVVIDSRDVRARFGLGDFTGQLFIHVIGGAGHDVVKYALDVFSADGAMLSCSHDANAWPADYYGGLPAPKADETVWLWVQNSHPCSIPAGAMGLNLMGSEGIAWLERDIAPYATCRISVADLLPEAAWPQQIEVQAGRHFVRPRYEVATAAGRQRIAHVNVERTDLRPDPAIPELGNLMGKGYILPAPVLPTDRWRSLALPTPMSTCQAELPVAALIIDSSGREMARHNFGRLPRDHSCALDVTALLNGTSLPGGYGHMELIYDFSDGGEADGWLHGLFRYEDRDQGYAADTSFGAHIFNTVLTYRGESQSYASAPPGLSTRLFLRLGAAPFETMCHLIYPASTPWHGASDTMLELYDGNGARVADRRLEIPCSGSHLWFYTETFGADERARAGDGAYVMITDATCRLFGYHGLLNGDGPFSIDHMFGF